MTEQKATSATVEETTPAADTSPSSRPQPPRDKKSGGMVLGAVAIVIALATGAGLYLNGKHQAELQAQANQSLSDKLDVLQQQAGSDKQQLANRPERRAYPAGRHGEGAGSPA